MSNIKHIPKGVLAFLALFVLISCFIGSLPASADSSNRYNIDSYYRSASSLPENLSGFFDNLTPYSVPSSFTGNPTSCVIRFDFENPSHYSDIVGSDFFISSLSNNSSFATSFNIAFYDSDGVKLSIVFHRGISYSITRNVSNGIASNTFSFNAFSTTSSVQNLPFKTIVFQFQLLTTPYNVLSISSNLPLHPVEPEPEPPTPATGEWQAFTQFIFGIFGTMGSIINNLLAAGGLSSIFFGFVFGIPIANFIIFLIEEIFDLEPYDPSSSWRREEHSLKELRPSDYNNFAGDPPSNRIGF